MSNLSRSILTASMAGAIALCILPASAMAMHGGGHGGGGGHSGGGVHFAGGAHFGVHFGGGNYGGHNIHMFIPSHRYVSPRRYVPVHDYRKPVLPHVQIFAWHYHKPIPVYGTPVIPIVTRTIVSTPNPAPVQRSVASCALPSATTVSVTFLPTVTAADITAFLQSYNVTLANGPDAGGIYQLRLSDQPLPGARVAEVLTSMRSQTAIVQSVGS